MKKIVFFSNKGGIGNTALVYHFSYMLVELGYKVLCADLDPQSNLSSMMLTEERLEEVYEDENKGNLTVWDAIRPLTKGTGDIREAHIESIEPNLSLLIGDLSLSTFEDKLSENWSKCLDADEYAFRITSSFHRVIDEAGETTGADYAVIDVGPNLGAINRASLIVADYVVLPVAADLFSLQGIKNLGTSLSAWHTQWAERLKKNPPEADPSLPEGKMKPIGYVVLQHSSNSNRIYKSYQNFAKRIPFSYQKYVLKSAKEENTDIAHDENCLSLLKHYHSLMPMALEVRKPIFFLKPADGAIGAHFQAVKKVYDDFKELSRSILQRCH